MTTAGGKWGGRFLGEEQTGGLLGKQVGAQKSVTMFMLIQGVVPLFSLQDGKLPWRKAQWRPHSRKALLLVR